MSEQSNWEKVIDCWSDDTWRLKVPGGWIYRYQELSLVFVPEPSVS